MKENPYPEEQFQAVKSDIKVMPKEFANVKNYPQMNLLPPKYQSPQPKENNFPKYA